jgi:glycosyltransferase involved in cell wall biosynthesis
MPMGVDARERFTPAGAPRNGEEILFVGRLVEKKGVAHLLDALVLVRRRRPAATLLVVGSGPLEPSLRERAQDLGLADAVRFAGAVLNPDLPAYYRRAAVLAVPSIVARDGDREGLGLVIAEALACECPVVASDLPAIADVVEEGVTGLIARQGDAADLSAKILALLEDPAKAAALAARGRRIVLERFDWQSVVGGYERLLASAGR